MKKLSELIDRYLVQISLLILFSVLLVLFPLVQGGFPPSYPLNILALRCLILNSLLLVPFAIFTRKEQKVLILIPGAGIPSSGGYLITGSPILLVLSIALTITSVLCGSLLAFSLIKFKFEGK